MARNRHGKWRVTMATTTTRAVRRQRHGTASIARTATASTARAFSAAATRRTQPHASAEPVPNAPGNGMACTGDASVGAESYAFGNGGGHHNCRDRAVNVNVQVVAEDATSTVVSRTIAAASLSGSAFTADETKTPKIVVLRDEPQAQDPGSGLPPRTISKQTF